MVALTPGAVVLAASLFLLEVPHLSTLPFLSESSSSYIFTVQPGSSDTLSANAALPFHSASVKLPTLLPPRLYLLSLHFPNSSCFWLFSQTSCFLFPSDSLRVLQWNFESLRARSIEIIHFISFHPVDLICIQESNLYLSSSFRTHEFSALRSDCTHSRSGILSHHDSHASGGVMIFVGRGYSFLNFLPPLRLFA